jgi:hypothetical protein
MKEAKGLGFLRQKGSNAMSNIVQFPSGTYLPPTPNVDALIGELAAVKIELARAQLAQIRLETRQASVLWSWYCFKRVVFWGCVLWLLATLMAPAKADSVNRSFYNEHGSFAGSSVTRGNSSSFYDGAGRFSGSAIRHGKWTSFYDGRGRYTGSSINTSPRR